MKKIFGFILSLVLVFGMAAPSWAVFHNPNRGSNGEKAPGKIERAKERAGEVKEKARTKVENVKERVGEKKEEVKNRVEEKKGEIREKREEVRKKVDRIKFSRAKKFFEKMVGRYAALIERLEDITDRAEKRMAKLKEKGVNTAGLEPLLLNVRAEIESARAKLAEIKAKFSAVENSEDTKASFEDVKAASEQMKERLRAIHRAITSLVKEMKASRELRELPKSSPTPAESLAPTPSPTESPISSPTP